MKQLALTLVFLSVAACSSGTDPKPKPEPILVLPPLVEDSPLPNLKATLGETTNLRGLAGTLVQLSGEIANPTTVAVSTVVVRWAIGGVEVASSEIESIVAGQSKPVTATVALPALSSGFYELALIADPEDKIAETDETDNIAAAASVIGIIHGYDLKGTILEVTAPTWRAGSIFSVKVLWRNDGSMASPGTSAKLNLIGPLPAQNEDHVQDLAVPPLLPRNELEVTYQVQPLRGGGDYFWDLVIPTLASEIEPADNFARSALWYRWASRLNPIWTAPTTEYTSAPAWGNATTDGALLFFYGTGRRGNWGQVHAVTAATGEPVWTRDVSDTVNGVPAFGDGESDGIFEVYVGARNGLYALRATDGAIKWRREFGFSVATPVLVDMVPDNGTLELVVTAGIPGGGTLAVVRADNGDDIFHYSQSSTDVTFYPGHFGGPAVADVTGDGKVDIVLANLTTTPNAATTVFAAADTSYSLLWSMEIEGPGSFIAPILIDIYSENKSDVIVGDISGKVTAFRGNDGTQLWSQTMPGMMLAVPMAMGETDGDAQAEIAIFWSENTTATNQTSILALADTATGVLHWTIEFAGQPVGGAVMADLDGDGYDDAVVALDTPRNTCLIATISSSGSIFDITDLPWRCYNSLSIVDTDADGIYEIQVGQIQVLATPYAVTGLASWPKQGRVAGNNNEY